MGYPRRENGCGGCKRRKTTSLKLNAVESRAYFCAKCMDFFQVKARVCGVAMSPVGRAAYKGLAARIPVDKIRDLV